jgi:D-beta-D-heptose 7-phosphate kinase / D-beta-D-heptose 1-phosphate adenosyltransferase
VTAGPLVVIGDSMLDIDIEGTADRLSPDAPVPVVDVQRSWHRPGGAGLAALIAAKAADEVVLITAMAADDAGEVLRDLLDPIVDVRPLRLRGSTVCKTRVSAAGVPMLRLDTGDGRAEGALIPPAVTEAIAQAGTIVISDYGRGVTALPALRERLTHRVAQVPLVWDPHPAGAEPVPGCALVAPNAAEAARFSRTQDAGTQGSRLCEIWQAQAVAVTRGDRGATVTDRISRSTTTVPVPERRAPMRPDTCGAGDAFAAAAAVTFRTGADAHTAVRAAVSWAADYVHAGAATSMSTAARSAFLPGSSRWSERRDPFELADRIRRTGGRLVATGGCFDLLHRGHVSLLEQARALGDALIVCLNSDASIRGAKGASRPIVGQDDRARVLHALEAVDGVAIFDEETPADLLARLQPDIWVKGTDYANRPMAEADVVRQFGGQIVLVPVIPGYSTSRLVDTATLNRRLEESAIPTVPQEAS